MLIRTLMGFITIFTLALAIGIIFQCRPINGINASSLCERRTNGQAGDWDNLSAKCGDQVPGTVASGVVNVVADSLLIVFVVPRIRKKSCTPYRA